MTAEDRASCRGITLLELLIGVAIFSFVLMVAMSFFQRFNTAGVKALNEIRDDQELNRLLTAIKLQWRYRASPDPSFVALSPASGMGTCGGIQITQQRAATWPGVTGTPQRTVSIFSQCSTVPTSLNPGPAQFLGAPSCIPEVVIQHSQADWPGDHFPAPNTALGTVACFTIDATNSTVSVLLQSLLVDGSRRSSSVRNRTVLTTADRSPGVQYVR